MTTSKQPSDEQSTASGRSGHGKRSRKHAEESGETNEGPYPVGRLWKRRYRTVHDAYPDLSYFALLGFGPKGFTNERAKVLWEKPGLLKQFITQLNLAWSNLDDFERAMTIKNPRTKGLVCSTCNEDKEPETVFPCCGGCSLVCRACLERNIDMGDDADYEICLGCLRQAPVIFSGEMPLTPLCRSCPRAESRCVGDCNRFVCENSIAYYTSCKKPICRPCSILGCACACPTCLPQGTK